MWILIASAWLQLCSGAHVLGINLGLQYKSMTRSVPLVSPLQGFIEDAHHHDVHPTVLEVCAPA